MKTYFKAHHPLTWTNMFYGGRSKRGTLVKESKGPWQRNVVIMYFNDSFWGEEKMKTREHKNIGET